MKALVWKEWREARMTIVLTAMLTVALGLAGMMMLHLQYPTMAIRSDQLGGIAIVVWCVSGLLCGAAMISPEVGSGSLQFLSVLPITRDRIWLAKVGVHATVVAMSVVATVIVLRLFILAAARANLISPTGSYQFGVFPQFFDLTIFGGDSWGVSKYPLVPQYFGLPLLLFAIAASISPMFDRTISALMASAITGVVVLSSCAESNDLIHKYASGNERALQWVLLLAAASLFLAASKYVFVRGETLLTAKRMMLAAEFGLPLGLMVIAIAVAHVLFVG